LLFHPHLHCVVPGGGISADGQRWIACRPGFFLPVRVLSCLFRRLFLEHLQTVFDQGKLQFFSSLERLRDRKTFLRYLEPLRKNQVGGVWQTALGGPEQVLNYLGRYTHRVAISNNRLLDIDHGQVSFHWKDYRHGDQQKTMTLEADEFIAASCCMSCRTDSNASATTASSGTAIASQTGTLPPTPGGGLNRYRPAALQTRLS